MAINHYKKNNFYSKLNQSFSIQNFQRGFSLLELLIAMAILGVVSISFLDMMDNQQKGTNLLEARIAELGVVRSIESYLISPDACKNTMMFKGPTASAGSQVLKPFGTDAQKKVWTIRDKQNGRVYNSGPGYFNNALKIKEMKLAQRNPVDLNNAADAQGMLDLVITFERKKLPTSGVSEKTYKLPVHVSLDSNKRVTACSFKRESTSTAANYVYAFHSQTTNIPSCPSGFTNLWTGYSFIQAHSLGATAAFLGEPGSCIRGNESSYRDSVLKCYNNSYCQKYNRTASHPVLLYLSGNNNGTAISRCRVCAGDQKIISVHNSGTNNPNCPSGWSSIYTWQGYIYLGNVYAASSYRWYPHTQNISSHGTCFRYFRKQPLASYNSSNNSIELPSYSSSHLRSLWLYNGRTTGTEAQKVRRCRVCIKD